MELNHLPARTQQALRLGLLLSGLLLVAGSRAEVRFDVFLGYDGTVREASWFPITCEIENKGPTFNGFIEVSVASFGGGEPHRLPIELPTGTTKRVVIPTFASSRFPSIWDVRLRDARGKVRAESAGVRPQRQLGWETKIIGALPRTAAGMVSVRAIQRNQPDLQPAAVRFQTEMFPDNPLVLEGLDALYLNSETAVKLRAGQAKALLAWLNAGGHLIVSIEQLADVTGVPWLRGVLPFTPQDAVNVAEHEELDRWLFRATSVTNTPPASGEPVVRSAFGDASRDAAFEAAEIRLVTGQHRDGKTVVTAGGQPLIVQADRGLGRITVLLFSPEREPFKSWKALPSLWTHLLGVPLELYTSTDFTSGYGQAVDGIFGAMIDSRQVHKLPVEWLVALLVVYLLVIGPVDRFWLKKINRPMLTWLTFPAYVVLFSGLIYLIGYRLRAGDSEYNELHVVDVLPTGKGAEWRGRTYVSIYSPVNARYPMQSELKFASFRAEYLGSRGGDSAEKMQLMQTGDSFAAEVAVPVWTSQLFLSDWWHSAELPLTAALGSGTAGATLLVNNPGSKSIPAARLALGRSVYDLGEIPARTEKEFVLQKLAGQPLADFVNNQARHYMEVAQQRQNAFGRSRSGQIDELPVASMVVSLLGEMEHSRNRSEVVLPPRLDVAGAVSLERGVLLAWAPGISPVPRLTEVPTKRGAVNTLWRIPVSAAQPPVN